MNGIFLSIIEYSTSSNYTLLYHTHVHSFTLHFMECHRCAHIFIVLYVLHTFPYRFVWIIIVRVLAGLVVYSDYRGFPCKCINKVVAPWKLEFGASFDFKTYFNTPQNLQLLLDFVNTLSSISLCTCQCLSYVDRLST
jgi:hypothetical protein